MSKAMTKIILLSFSGDYIEIDVGPVLGKNIKIEMNNPNEYLEICEFEVYEGETFDLISNKVFERIHVNNYGYDHMSCDWWDCSCMFLSGQWEKQLKD